MNVELCEYLSQTLFTKKPLEKNTAVVNGIQSANRTDNTVQNSSNSNTLNTLEESKLSQLEDALSQLPDQISFKVVLEIPPNALSTYVKTTIESALFESASALGSTLDSLLQKFTTQSYYEQVG
jgi:tRNA U38,U39,U40 pseudouridine synthase TruA